MNANESLKDLVLLIQLIWCELMVCKSYYSSYYIIVIKYWLTLQILQRFSYILEAE